jgi:chemotaxis signal transduction protein
VTDASGDRLIGFHVAGVGAALPLGLVREVTERPSVVRVPGSHAFVSGVTLHGGVALPVYDLRRFDSLWSGRGGRAPRSGTPGIDRLIVCAWGEVPLGLLGEGVDVLDAVGPAPGPEDDEGAWDVMSGDFVLRRLRIQGEAIALLDADRLFASLGVPATEPSEGRETGEDDPARG